ncbi:hypothetical protein ACFL1B_05415 [Nanoarchaeota archaeon]
MRDFINQLLAERMQLGIYAPYDVIKIYDSESGKTTIKQASYLDFFLEQENRNYDALMAQEKTRLEEMKKGMKPDEFARAAKYSFKHEFSSMGDVGWLLTAEERLKRAKENAQRAVRQKKIEIDRELHSAAVNQLATMRMTGRLTEAQEYALSELKGLSSFEWAKAVLFILGIVDLHSHVPVSPVFTQKGEFLGLHRKSGEKPEPIEEETVPEEEVQDE